MKKQILAFAASIIASAIIFPSSAFAAWTPTQTIIPSGAGAGSAFGLSTSVYQDYMAIGEPGAGSDQGQVHIYEYNSGTGVWDEMQTISDPGGEAGDQFGSSVSMMSEDQLVVGALGDDSYAGSVHVYDLSVGTWTRDIKFQPGDGAAGDYFGHVVATDGTKIVVGAPYAHTSNADAGAAYVLKHNGTNWVQEQKLTASDHAVSDNFGYSVDISDETVLVGAPNEDAGGANAGAAYFFTYTSSWSQTKKNTGSNANDQYGYGVAMYEDYALVGEPGNDKAYVYTDSSGTWPQEQAITVPSGDENSLFGGNVDISLEKLVIGAKWYSDTNDMQGATYMYDRINDTWTFANKFISRAVEDDEYLGSSVSISEGLHVVAGGYGNDHNGNNNVGVAYTYEYSEDISNFSTATSGDLQGMEPTAIFNMTSDDLENLAGSLGDFYDWQFASLGPGGAPGIGGPGMASLTANDLDHMNGPAIFDAIPPLSWGSLNFDPNTLNDTTIQALPASTMDDLPEGYFLIDFVTGLSPAQIAELGSDQADTLIGDPNFGWGEFTTAQSGALPGTLGAAVDSDQITDGDFPWTLGPQAFFDGISAVPWGSVTGADMDALNDNPNSILLGPDVMPNVPASLFNGTLPDGTNFMDMFSEEGQADLTSTQFDQWITGDPPAVDILPEHFTHFDAADLSEYYNSLFTGGSPAADSKDMSYLAGPDGISSLNSADPDGYGAWSMPEDNDVDFETMDGTNIEETSGTDYDENEQFAQIKVTENNGGDELYTIGVNADSLPTDPYDFDGIKCPNGDVISEVTLKSDGSSVEFLKWHIGTFDGTSNQIFTSGTPAEGATLLGCNNITGKTWFSHVNVCDGGITVGSKASYCTLSDGVTVVTSSDAGYNNSGNKYYMPLVGSGSGQGGGGGGVPEFSDYIHLLTLAICGYFMLRESRKTYAYLMAVLSRKRKLHNF